jgi:hypothetical protein
MQDILLVRLRAESNSAGMAFAWRRAWTNVEGLLQLHVQFPKYDEKNSVSSLLQEVRTG